MAALPLGCKSDSSTPADSGESGNEFAEERKPCAASNPLRNVYFGDLHIHTALSFDAWIWDVRTTPEDAYAFAKGEALELPPYDEYGKGKRTLQLRRPLDFAAVTDHAEFLAEVEACVTPGSEAYDTLSCQLFRRGDFLSTVVMANQLFLPEPVRSGELCGQDGVNCPALAASVWKRVQQAAEDAYDRTSECTFTSFVAYEYTGVPKISNMHRNMIFRNANVPERPVSYFEQPTKLGLWAELKRTCLDGMRGCDVLGIPHNTNESNGNAFFVEYPGAGTLQEQREQAALRVQAEPLVEIFQHKGDSECSNGLYGVTGQPDELCDFEKLREPDAPDCEDRPGGGGEMGIGCVSRLDFVRFILLEGLREEERLGVNPYRMGIIAGTHTHNATAGAVEEDRFQGHAGKEDDTPQKRITEEKLVNNPGGLAAVWAEENSRNAIFEALKRRETYGTSGPRMIVRFFGGWEIPLDMCNDPDFVEKGYQTGVPMGGILPEKAKADGAPRFAVCAMREPDSEEWEGTPLQRIQIVKGWLDSDRELHYKVFEVAGNAGNGAGVNPGTCEPLGQGFDTLCAVWADPEFDPDQRATYYARVVQIPTCRWSAYECIRLPPEERPELCNDPDLEREIQERAWTSPIWYGPD